MGLWYSFAINFVRLCGPSLIESRHWAIMPSDTIGLMLTQRSFQWGVVTLNFWGDWVRRHHTGLAVMPIDDLLPVSFVLPAINEVPNSK